MSSSASRTPGARARRGCPHRRRGLQSEGTRRARCAASRRLSRPLSSIPVHQHFLPAPPQVCGADGVGGAVDCYGGIDDDIDQLILYGEGLSGTIPPQIGRFSKLTYLGLGANSLSGTLPATLALLTKLTHLHVWKNRISGSIAAELGSLSPSAECNLVDGSRWPAIDGNHFDCPLPSLAPVCALSAVCSNVSRLQRLLPPPSTPPPPTSPAQQSGGEAAPIAAVAAVAAAAAALLAASLVAVAWQCRSRRRARRASRRNDAEVAC